MTKYSLKQWTTSASTLRSNLLIHRQCVDRADGRSSRLKLQIQRFITPLQVGPSQLECLGQMPCVVSFSKSEKWHWTVGIWISNMFVIGMVKSCLVVKLFGFQMWTEFWKDLFRKVFSTLTIFTPNKSRLDSNIESKSLNNTYLNIIEILFLL